jgi:enamine deaminase RidA (YjgF/YER057c/UK114 family)
MKSNTQEASGACRLEIRTSERETFSEFHITANAEGAAPAWIAAEAVYAQIAPLLAREGIQPIQEKLYGLTRVREEVLRQREAAYRSFGLDRTIPVTWVEGVPLQHCDFVGVQIWGVRARNGEPCVKTVDNPVTGRARVWEGAGFRMLHLPCVRGTTATGALAGGAAAQAQRMFENIGTGLEANGFKYPQVLRTWIYCSRLLEWYADLNRIRTAHYRKVGLGVEGGPAFPASTGIQGRSDGDECLVDVLALDSSNPEIASAKAIRCSPRQDSSFNYGSAFSRGMTIELERRRTVHISGTASINTAGASTHPGDAECQSLETLMSIAAILEQQGGSLRSITSATLFCKDRASWEAWNRVSRLLHIPEFPKVCVLADVCRHDLLVEMEAVAVI